MGTYQQRFAGIGCDFTDLCARLERIDRAQDNLTRLAIPTLLQKAATTWDFERFSGLWQAI